MNGDGNRWLTRWNNLNGWLGGEQKAVYTLYLPLHFNNKLPIPTSTLKWAQDELLSWSGGLSRLLPRDGVWLGPQHMHRDWSLPIQAEAPLDSVNESHFASLVLSLAEMLDQGEIYYHVQPIWRLPTKKGIEQEG